MKGCQFFRIPEVSLCFLAFFLNFFWEVVHTHFYTFKDSVFSTLLYGWLHCSLGDVLISLGAFWLVSLVSRSRRWFLSLTRANFMGFIMVGVAYTFFSEWANVHLIRSWVYNESMPIVPWTKVGLTPVLQWMIIPSFAILMVRHYHLLAQGVERKSLSEK